MEYWRSNLQLSLLLYFYVSQNRKKRKFMVLIKNLLSSISLKIPDHIFAYK